MSFRKLLALATILFGLSSHAATTLEFTTSSGTVGPNDVIEVWLTLSTDTGFTFDPDDPDGDSTYGGAIDPSDVPTGGYSPDANGGAGAFVDFDFIDFVYGTISASCSGSFVIDSSGDCGLGGVGTEDYVFSFGSGWTSGGEFSLGAGESLDFLWGAFTPVAGGASPGTYDYFAAGIALVFEGFGFDDFGDEVSVTGFLGLDTTCTAGDSSCAFTRTVASPVPVPAAVWLFASALLGLTGMSRRRSV